MTTQHRWSVGLMAVAVLVLACQAESPQPEEESWLERLRLPIIGGSPESGYPAVGAVITSNSLCTGTLIASKIVVTAAHCISPYDPPKWFYMGSSIKSPTSIMNVDKSIRHPDYGTGYSLNAQIHQHDIAVLVLKTAAPATPMPYRTASVNNLKGQPITFVGFGKSSIYNDYSSGTKMKVTVTMGDVTTPGFWNYTTSSNPKNTCVGDSGGPAFHNNNGVEEIVGVVSSGDADCVQTGFNTRIDTHAAWLAQMIAQHDPGGTQPGNCGNGVCDVGETSDACPSDCPVSGGKLGDPCSGSTDCSSGMICVVAGTGGVCASYCADPNGGTGCPSGYHCVGLQNPPPNGNGVCVKNTTDCGDGVCDEGENYQSCPKDCVKTGCGTIDYVGCCDSQVLTWCEEGKLYMLPCGDNPQCGWNSKSGYYDCGTAGGSEPGGQYPRTCGGTAGPVCGNGTCETGEMSSTCPADCGAANGCGDGVCFDAETFQTCPADCISSGCSGISFFGCCKGDLLQWCQENKTMQISCDNNRQCGWNADGGYYDCGTPGTQDPTGHHPRTCGTDEPMAVCGDGRCQAPETSESCPLDCVIGSVLCGDGKCEAPETSGSCPADCVIGSVSCGDGKCEAPETSVSCALDCLLMEPVCGDGTCETLETATSCPLDCAVVNPQCGDGTCGLDETCDSCPEDCGECWFDQDGNPNCSHPGARGSNPSLVLVLILFLGLTAVRRCGYCRRNTKG